MTSQLNINEYSEKAFVVRGDTKPYKDQLLNRGGKWNPNLKGGAGWIFSKRHMPFIQVFVHEANRGKLTFNKTAVNKTAVNKTAVNPILSKKRKADETLRERYERKLRKKIRKELEADIEAKVRAEYDNRARDNRAFHFPAIPGDRPAFSVGLNNGVHPTNLKDSRKQISVSKWVLAFIVIIVMVFALAHQMGYIPDNEMIEWLKTNVETVRSVNITELMNL